MSKCGRRGGGELIENKSRGENVERNFSNMHVVWKICRNVTYSVGCKTFQKYFRVLKVNCIR